MQGTSRKIVQAILYEAIAVACVAPALALMFETGMAHSTLLSVLMSGIAMSWNMAFNWAFERWEARQPQRARTLLRRLLHALGFEGGLVLLLLPLVAFWLDIGLWTALLTNLALFAFFFVYAFVFQWGFDKVFDVPVSARQEGEQAGC
ncbi:PACE efflux transporter [Pseudomonas fulva]|nr:PACE efflux transporter [Pseudomonas fulva]MBF8780443.1 PACE efflux transporter [Pseudomonas fulva]